MQTIINCKRATIHVIAPTREGKEIAATLSTISSSIAPPEPSDPWPEQGGIYMGTMPPQAGKPAYHLVLAPILPAHQSKFIFGGYGKSIDGLSDCDGKNNTELLTASEAEHPAAKYCAEFVHAGFSDFYLPSSREAAMMRAVDPLQFAEGYHWTSTQRSAFDAFIQDFRDGYQNFNYKDGSFLVRPVRRVTALPL